MRQSTGNFKEFVTKDGLIVRIPIDSILFIGVENEVAYNHFARDESKKHYTRYVIFYGLTFYNKDFRYYVSEETYGDLKDWTDNWKEDIANQ